MSALPEQPFNEHEQRYYLAEILKTSYIPPSDLLRVIRDRGIDPRWTAMALPNGRSIDSCVANLNFLTSQMMASPPTRAPSYGYHAISTEMPHQRVERRSIGPPQPPASTPAPAPSSGHHPSYQTHPEAPGHPQQSGGELPIQARPSIPDPSMQPQFSHFAAVNEASRTPRNYQTGQEGRSTGSDKKGKKRGRPSKAEYEERAALAAARGEVYPPPKKLKAPKPLVKEAPGVGTQESPSREKAARKLDASYTTDFAPKTSASTPSTAPDPVVPARGSSLEKTADAGYRTQMDVSERIPPMVIPESQITRNFRPSPLTPSEAREQSGQIDKSSEEGVGTRRSDSAPMQPHRERSSAIVHEAEPLVKEEPTTATG